MEESLPRGRAAKLTRNNSGVKPQRQEYTGNRFAVTKERCGKIGPEPNLASKHRFPECELFLLGSG
jgi:hypothetical protein